jgi:hypothetical protein
VKTYYQRQVDLGKMKELEVIAKEADKKRERGEPVGPLPTLTILPIRRYDPPPDSLSQLGSAASPQALRDTNIASAAAGAMVNEADSWSNMISNLTPPRILGLERQESCEGGRHDWTDNIDDFSSFTPKKLALPAKLDIKPISNKKPVVLHATISKDHAPGDDPSVIPPSTVCKEDQVSFRII